jgi:ubiquinone/menaquinone biosynthesis C-methylase UbiE
MKKIEPVAPNVEEGLTTRIQDFWSRRVNAEHIMGRAVSNHTRGDDAYFHDLETQRYRSHRHLLPWIEAMEPRKTVLEIGCGVGLDTFTMANHGLDMIAVDLTHVGVSTAQSRFRRHSRPGLFLAADACHLPFPDASFDYVYSFGVLHHVADTEKSIREVHRLLKPGGQARIMLYHRHSLNELVHRLLGVPFEDKDELCPVVRRFTVPEIRILFSDFSHVQVGVDYLFGEGYGVLFRLTPQWLYDFLSRRWGWHLMVAATK